MMYCREQFLKCPPDSNAKSQLLDKDPKANDGDAKKVRSREKHRKSTLDDSLNWVTDEGESSDDDPSPRRRRNKLRAIKDQLELMVMKEIFDAQTDEVKEVILSLHRMQMKQRKACREQQLTKSEPLIVKKQKKRVNVGFNGGNNLKKKNKHFPTAAPGTLQNNCKILARLQRGRRCRGKPRSSQNKRKKYPRRRRRANAKKGNRQGRKRYFRAQKFFNKGIFVIGRKLLDEVWRSVKDPNSTATSFCNNNTHGLSKVHRRQIALYERIEEDLHRLDMARQERAERAEERKAEQKKKEELRQGLKNKIEARAAARAERDALRKERRAARKQRALEKRIRKEQAKALELSYSERQDGRVEVAII